MVAKELEDRSLPRLFASAAARGSRCPESSALGLLGGSRVIDRVAGAGIEMAVMDAELRAVGRSLAEHLELEVSSVPFGGLVGITPPGAHDAAVGWASELIDQGCSRLRVKIGRDDPVGPIMAIAEAFPAVAMHVDANGAFEPATLEALRPLDALGLVCIEQPLPGRDLATMARWAATFSTPWCLDEAITSRRQARDAVRYGAAQAICVKPARVGGLRVAMGIAADLGEASVPGFVGGLFETGLGRSFLGVLAARPELSLISDVAAPSTYLEDDPCELEGPHKGRQPLHHGPGVGPWPQHARLEKVASQRR
jgi:O-succinylbenzoate synthase